MEFAIYRRKQDNVKQIDLVKDVGLWLGRWSVVLARVMRLRRRVLHEGIRERVGWRAERENLSKCKGKKGGYEEEREHLDISQPQPANVMFLQSSVFV
jgi:hypothetical protein